MQDTSFQTKEMIAFRDTFIQDNISKIKELNRENFAIKQHLKFVDLYADKDSFGTLVPLDLKQLEEEIAPLVLPYDDEINAIRFDALMYAIEPGYVAGQKYTRGIRELIGKGLMFLQIIADIQALLFIIRYLMH